MYVLKQQNNVLMTDYEGVCYCNEMGQLLWWVVTLGWLKGNSSIY